MPVRHELLMCTLETEDTEALEAYTGVTAHRGGSRVWALIHGALLPPHWGGGLLARPDSVLGTRGHVALSRTPSLPLPSPCFSGATGPSEIGRLIAWGESWLC